MHPAAPNGEMLNFQRTCGQWETGLQRAARLPLSANWSDIARTSAALDSNTASPKITEVQCVIIRTEAVKKM